MMSIGFAGQPGVEQSYALTPSQKDQEFDIRDHGEAGWGLLDAQTGEWLTMLSRSGGREEVRAIGVRRDDAFSRMMAGVVHDTAVLYNDYANSELAVSPSGNKPDTTSAQITPIDPPVVKPEVIAAAPNRSDSPATQTGATTMKTDSPTAKTDTPPVLTDATAGKADSPSAQTGATTGKVDSPAATTRKADSPAISSGAVSKPDSPVAAASRPDTPSHSVKSNPSAPLLATAGKPDSIANLLNRPDSGASDHKSPPVDSSAHDPLYRPTPLVVKVSERKLTHSMRLVYADKSKEAKTDTVVVIIPLDTPQAAAEKVRIAGPDSSRTAAKPHNTVPDSSPAVSRPRNTVPDSSPGAAARPRNTVPDSSPGATLRPHNTVPDSSPGSTVRPRNTVLDSDRTAATKPRAVDSNRNAARSKGSNIESPNGVRLIVPTPVSQPADKSHPNDSVKKSTTRGPLPYINSDCHAFATDYDIDKLRVKMLEAAKDEDRIAAALKIFKTKCFYTRQIKALSEVFTTDASKYRFFETAYPFAADEHFRELGALLSDPVYQNKFKSLVH